MSVLLGIHSSFCIGASAAEPWLQKMSSSISEQNYQISFVVLTRNKEAQPYTWRHSVIEGVEMEHLSRLNGPTHEVLRIGNKISYFEPNTPPYTLMSDVINGPIPFELLRNPLNLLNAYDFILVGRTRVSGLPAQQIRIVSKDKSRYSYNLWLDQQTGIVLKWDMLDLQDKVLEQIQVTSLNVLNEPDEFFEKIEKEKIDKLAAVKIHEDVQHGWQLNWLPEGMKIVATNIHRLPLTGQLTDYVMLSDGLVNVSVYLQRVNDSQSHRVPLLIDTNTLLSLQVDSVAATIIGKIPLKTADAIAASIGAADARE